VLAVGAQQGDGGKLKRRKLARAAHAGLDHLDLGARLVQPLNGPIQLTLLDLGPIQLQKDPFIFDAAPHQAARLFQDLGLCRRERPSQAAVERQ
jgi:hypothetical protein